MRTRIDCLYGEQLGGPRVLPEVQDRHVFASRARRCGISDFFLAFQLDKSDESSWPIRRTKDKGQLMTNAETTHTAATVGEQGANVAPEKAPSKKGATQKKGAPKGQKAAKGGKAKANKKAAKPPGPKKPQPRSTKARAQRSWN